MSIFNAMQSNVDRGDIPIIVVRGVGPWAWVSISIVDSTVTNIRQLWLPKKIGFTFFALDSQAQGTG